MEAHHDRYKMWHQLPLEHQLNVFCDKLTKQAVGASVNLSTDGNQHNTSPEKGASVFVKGVKITSGVVGKVCYALGHNDAQKFYTASLGKRDHQGDRYKDGGLGWTKESFDADKWRALGQDMESVIEATRNGTAIWVTNGSYNKIFAPTVSGSGWLLYCTAKKQKLYGKFFERSGRAGSYRGELLGLLAIYTLCAALEELYKMRDAS